MDLDHLEDPVEGLVDRPNLPSSVVLAALCGVSGSVSGRQWLIFVNNKRSTLQK